MKLTITDTQYKQLPERLQKLFTKMYNPSSEEVRECFPDTKTGKAIRSNSGGKTFGGENIKPIMEDLGYEDGGGNASRFFKSIIYQAKASKSERNAGCEELEDKFRAGLAGADRDTDEPLDDVSERFRTQPAKNNHPTVKPIALMEYLIKMVTKEGYTVLDPFMGSGTTALACKNINRKFIGFELEKEYVEIANARIKEEQVGLFTM